MKRLLRWVGIALGSLVALGLIAYVAAYVRSEGMLRHTYEIPAVSISIPTDPESILEGRRLATIHGCFAGCHGKEAEGGVLFDQPIIAHVGESLLDCRDEQALVPRDLHRPLVDPDPLAVARSSRGMPSSSAST